MTAHDILTTASKHMRDRAATYDRPEGERSMGATVEAFESITGHALTEEQGYVLAAIAFSNGIDFKDGRGHSFRNISGFEFGRLQVVGAHELESKTSHWLCRCQCGNFCRVSISNLTSGKQVSCGCYRDESRAKRAMLSRKSQAHKSEMDRIRKRRYNKSEKGKAAQRRYFIKNMDACIKRAEKWKSNNPDASRSSVRNRRARLRDLPGSHTSSDISAIGVEQAWMCAACDKDIHNCFHVDHVVPVSSGGSNGPENLQLLCPTCNLKKGAKPLSVFLAEMWPSLFSVHFEGFYNA